MPAKPGDETSISLIHRLGKSPADPQAWDECVERYRPMIRAWCLKWRLQESDADDVVQEVLVSLVDAMRRFQYDPARSFRGWLKTVTQHALSKFVTRRRKDVGRAAAPAEMLAEFADARTDLEHQLDETFNTELLELAMHLVKKRVKAVTWDAFQLTAIQGLSGEAAAAKLQIPVPNVFVARNRVQKMLREEARILKNGPR
jgi:RNA polymerase sigma-70 factor (ECF subfamily)